MNKICVKFLFFVICVTCLSYFFIVIFQKRHIGETYYYNQRTTGHLKDYGINDETVVATEIYTKLKTILKCDNRYFEFQNKTRGEFWVLQNFVKAKHGPVDCFRYVTFVTQGDLTFLDNLEFLVKRWQAPISMALHAPGTDLEPTISSIRYLKDCSPARDLINRWISFHIFFHRDHMPTKIPSMSDFKTSYNCSLDKPYYMVNSSSLYRSQKNLLYPINVARNIARDASLTHYFLSLDVELYPIPKFGARFLNMLARKPSLVNGEKPKVFVLLPFEVEADQLVPENKTRLLEMLKANTSIPFHKYVCPSCHKSPIDAKWLREVETPLMDITGWAKRRGNWEPLFVSSHSLPYLDERLSWDGMRDKMTQAFAMCLQDYDFLILSNGFVVHHPGIKIFKEDSTKDPIVAKQWKFIKNVIMGELKKIHGDRKGCIL